MAFESIGLGTGMKQSTSASNVYTGGAAPKLDLNFGRQVPGVDLNSFSDGMNIRASNSTFNPNTQINQDLLTQQLQNSQAGGLGADAKGSVEGLGDGSMDLKTKFGIGLGLAQTGMNAYLGFQQNKLAKDQYNESKRQFNTNTAMQKATLSGNLSDQYSTSANPEMLASSKDAYLAQYGLGK